jgi:pyridoxal phosphate enzyme (YggS family)
MPADKEAYQRLKDYFSSKNVQLVAVSKTKPVEDILELYALGQRDFGENYVQELAAKQPLLPGDIHWHFIGHLQSNKIKFIAPFVHLIHGVDSLKLLLAINKEGIKAGRVIHVLLQMHIASEETKFGFSEDELGHCLEELKRMPLTHVHISGFMGMASFTDNISTVREEFRRLNETAQKYYPRFSECNVMQADTPCILSMGMSGDYACAIEEGSNMVRIGSLLFGARVYGGA